MEGDDDVPGAYEAFIVLLPLILAVEAYDYIKEKLTAAYRVIW